MNNKYKFTILSNANDIGKYQIRTKFKQKEYMYLSFSDSRKIDCETDCTCYFSSLGRLIKADGIKYLYGITADECLKCQLQDIIDTHNIVIMTRKKLELKPIEFAKLLSVRPTDVNMWQTMLAKPDSFKLEIMKYILSNNICGDEFVDYLLSKTI